jgi:DNA-binding LytR/AlgR family response regulator
MKIAICDDDAADSLLLQEYISRFDTGLTCAVFNSAPVLLDALREDFYDLIFLDIEMGALSGFDAAKLIMEDRDKPLIVFVTKSSKYTIQGYEVAFRYLVKPLHYADFSRVMKAALEQIVPQKVAVDIGGREHLFSVREIYYFEIFGHRVRIRTVDRVYECRNSLKNIEDMLAGCAFVRPHNSYLVNIEHIVTASQTELVMKDGMKISISRKKKDESLRLIYQFLRR